MTNPANRSSVALLWSTHAPVLGENVSHWLDRHDWHYSVTMIDPKPVVSDWMTVFVEDINTLEMFPCRKRFTDEAPGILPICHQSLKGVSSLTIMVAMPPGAWRGSMAAYEAVLPVFESATRYSFNELKPRVRPVTPLQIEWLLERIGVAPVEFVTDFVREHHARCSEPTVSG